MPEAQARLGAYGLHLPTLTAAADLLVEAPADWPSWAVDVEVLRPAEMDAQRPALDTITPTAAVCALAGSGWMRADRARARTTIVLDHRPDANRLLHPFFSVSAAVVALWSGNTAIHAAAVTVGDGAWAFLGDKGSGKSSTAAAFADAGAGVLTDDVLVIRGCEAFAGPRSIDLRTDAAPRHPAAEPLGLVGARDRWRMTTAGSPPVVALRGFVVLEWGDDVAVEPVEEERRLETLLRNLTLRIPAFSQHLRQLSQLPMVRLSRPQRPESLPATLERLRGVVG